MFWVSIKVIEISINISGVGFVISELESLLKFQSSLKVLAFSFKYLLIDITRVGIILLRILLSTSHVLVNVLWVSLEVTEISES